MGVRRNPWCDFFIRTHARSTRPIWPIKPNQDKQKKGFSTMKTSEMFPARYLKAGDFPTPIILTIERVDWEKMHDSDGDEVEKPVLYFKEFQKGLVLNKTNCDIIRKMYGDESDNWNGKRVTVIAVKVTAFNKVVDALRFDEKLPGSPKSSSTTDQINKELGDAEVPA
jgi:hypothetical protein